MKCSECGNKMREYFAQTGGYNIIAGRHYYYDRCGRYAHTG